MRCPCLVFGSLKLNRDWLLLYAALNNPISQKNVGRVVTATENHSAAMLTLARPIRHLAEWLRQYLRTIDVESVDPAFYDAEVAVSGVGHVRALKP